MAEFLKVLLRRSLVSGGIGISEFKTALHPESFAAAVIKIGVMPFRLFLPNSNEQASLEKSIFTNLQIFYFQRTSLFVSPNYRNTELAPPEKRFILEML